ncbi:hypothetical protein [Bacillus dakarensis]|uniref:hypothetical protein n=1 Tax=Robertmurraya dakarensis TaxID=1926278 RepID=UPI000981D6A5|nr:hypothetical protein [Bacillus dakarensis]
MDPKRHYYKVEILYRKTWVKFITLILILGLISLQFYSNNLAWNFEILKPNEKILDYFIRIFMFVIPAVITIFTFVYREKKDASYSNLKTSNIITLFLYTVSLSILTLVYSISTSVELSNITKSSQINSDTVIRFQITFSLGFLTFLLLIVYFYYLLRNMDIRYSSKKTLKKTLKLHNFIKYLYLNDNKKEFSYKHLFEEYNHLIESNFQLIIAAISRKNFSNIENELKNLFALSNDYFSTYIDITSEKNLKRLLSVTEKDLLYKKVFSLDFRVTESTELEEDLSEKIYYMDNLIEVYKTIVYSYKTLIREASTNGVTNIQKTSLLEFSRLNPVKFYKFELENLQVEEYVWINNYYQELARCYQTALFEIIKEFSDEKTVEYSYLIEQISKSIGLFNSLDIFKGKNDQQFKNFYSSLLKKQLQLLESLFIWSVETNNVRFLTESMNLLLNQYYSHVHYPDGLENEVKEKLTKETSILNRYNYSADLVTGIKDYSSNGIFKELAVTGVIKIILHSLYKSIEIGHYACTGYIIKVSMSHFTIKNYLKAISGFIKKILERRNNDFDLGYYHYSFNNFSKLHCLQKLILLVSYQILGRVGKSYKDELKELIKILFLNNDKELLYMVEKINAASKSYGMTTINKKVTSVIKTILYF